MSGHSKWANIKRQKAAVDAKKGVLYAKVSREVIVAARQGGGDPSTNFQLRQAIERAKAEGVPSDNIARAIEKGCGSGASNNLEELTYEGYGPGGIAIMVRCTTDNRNRTAGDLRSYFTKYGGNLGETGCVGWMFKERGEIIIERNPKLNEDDLLLAAVEAGADDIDASNEETITVTCDPLSLEYIRDALAKAEYTVATSTISMSAITSVEVTDSNIARQLIKLLDVLENHDDVSEVYTNFEMETNLLQSCLA